MNAIATGLLHARQDHFLLPDEKTGDLAPRGRSIIDRFPVRRFGEPDYRLGILCRQLSRGAEFVNRPNA